MLIHKGKALFQSPRTTIDFTGNQSADALLNNLSNFPHAFVLACVMDKQVKAEIAWSVPYRIAEKLNGLDFGRLEQLGLEEVIKLESLGFRGVIGIPGRGGSRTAPTPGPLHRFPAKMAKYLYQAIQHIAQNYEGDAARIWINRRSQVSVATAPE